MVVRTWNDRDLRCGIQVFIVIFCFRTKDIHMEANNREIYGCNKGHAT